MQLPYSDELEIQYLNRLFDNTSECYKFFWFQAIMIKVSENKSEITYEELIDEMIAEAWYMVTEYHLNLGPRDNLESLVLHIQDISGMKPSEKKENIIAFLKDCTDKTVIRQKKVLTQNVPYRLQAPFMTNMKTQDWNVSGVKLIERINHEERLMYYFVSVSGMHTTIRIQPDWYQYFQKNQEIIEGWLQFNMIQYLQRRNPSVPGIADKLYPPTERKLDKVRNYWKLLLSRYPVQEIYGHVWLDQKDIAIDHFVPWSYVAHDEMWNLSPTTKSINSKKSNNLPDWDTYFHDFANIEFCSYQAMWEDEIVHREFEKCAKDHLNNQEIRNRIYREGHDFNSFSNALEEVVSPVYQAAKNCGFRDWLYEAS